ncbi:MULTISPECIES: TetR/AcrR family transcriptional regulator [Streptomyces]|uniref:TetR/AcrR family transcriptional regulator n=1 Tax=Streptomyces eurythermus TaxID=42237 RepID=A0ABW6Z5C1_9ACTN|nr:MULTISPECIES: TetR/AcrR family transcriptional regulator [Streptomyces]QIS69392.1 TetR/AcrR family transcriptional regulator [Streptomyces sp. DSM 40868]WDM14133.1 TetR/AcrR family transcriptional regulator [Streptomyces lavenduligriseus]
MTAQPRRSDARRNRARLVEAATALFDEVGTDAASMNDIARRAGVGPGTLWRHFPDKDALTAEVVGRSLDGLAALAAELPGSPDDPDFLRQWVSALVRHITRYRGLAVRYAEAARSADGPLGARCRAVEEAAAGLLERARERGQVRADLTAPELIRLATAVAWVSETAAPSDTTARLLDLVFEGVRPH